MIKGGWTVHLFQLGDERRCSSSHGNPCDSYEFSSCGVNGGVSELSVSVRSSAFHVAISVVKADESRLSPFSCIRPRLSLRQNGGSY